MIEKRIKVTGNNHKKVIFNDYYHLHINKENTCCKIHIPDTAKLLCKSTGKTKSVQSESFITVGDNINVYLSGDIVLNIDCSLIEINHIIDKQIELVCKINN